MFGVIFLKNYAGLPFATRKICGIMRPRCAFFFSIRIFPQFLLPLFSLKKKET